MKCPKCGYENEAAEECARCGVIFAKYANQKPEQPLQPSEPASSFSDHGPLERLLSRPALVIQQNSKHWYEILFNWEQSNQYHISDHHGRMIGVIEERSQGLANALIRIFLGSHRPLDIEVLDFQTNDIALNLTRSFFFFLSDLDVATPDGRKMGSIHRQFDILYKRYDLRDQNGDLFATIASPLWRLWTFPIFDRSGKEVAVISKKWSGLAQEIFTDADNFGLDFGDVDWTLQQKAVIFAAALSIDFDFFENNQNR